MKVYKKEWHHGTYFGCDGGIMRTVLTDSYSYRAQTFQLILKNQFRTREGPMRSKSTPSLYRQINPEKLSNLYKAHSFGFPVQFLECKWQQHVCVSSCFLYREPCTQFRQAVYLIHKAMRQHGCNQKALFLHPVCEHHLCMGNFLTPLSFLRKRKKPFYPQCLAQ